MTKPITDKALQYLKPGDDKPINIKDHPGLRVRRGDNSTTFYHRYNSPVSGKTVKATLGRYGTTEEIKKNPRLISLKDAKGLWYANSKLLDNNTDPRDQKKQVIEEKRQEARVIEQTEAEKRATLKQLIRDHLNHKNLDGWQARDRALTTYFADHLDTTAVNLSRQQVKSVLLGIERAGKPTMRNRVMRYGSAMYNWAIKKDWPEAFGIPGLVELNPFSQIDMLEEKPREHVPSNTDLGIFFKKLPDSLLDSLQQDAVWMIALTGCRGNEVCGMSWDEIQGNEWRIPGSRVKNKRDHLVYLSPTAKVILNQHKGEGYVFPNEKTSKGYVRLDGIEKGLRLSFEAMGITPFRLHDLRRAFASWMGENGISEEVHDRVLNHYRKDIRKVYNRATYNDPARKAWQKWARHLTGLVQP